MSRFRTLSARSEPSLTSHPPSWQSRAKVIFRATKQHAFNLAKFVTIYKTLLLVQKKMNKGKERSLDTFIAGLIGGYAVFGERNAVNEQVSFVAGLLSECLLICALYNQIVLYVVSRVVASFIPRATSGYKTAPDSALASSTVKPLPPDSKYFTVFAALSWGAVMWLFRHRGETIQPGMFNSMKYLYLDSNAWKDLRTLFWHNT